ncbi:MAG: hypothetical protein IPK22_22090 [Verrucomicrobiaceae bacterium]|nr:hypothetical protein [Verrucomicrobiaceae bacterium]
MKSLLTFAVVAVILYVAWDMFGDSVLGSVKQATGGVSSGLSSSVNRAEAADFNARYDGAIRKLTLTSPKNADLNVRVNPEDLSMYLKLPGTLVPHVHISYDASSFASTAEQNAFESTVRREVDRANARASFSATGRPKSL